MKRDFSDSAYNELISLVNEVENEKWCDFTDWIGDGWYGFQEWLGVLNISHYIDTYTVKGKMSLEEVSFEESIKTEDEVGSITSTIGIKKKNDNGWTPLPVPAVEPEPIQLPQFEAPDINWGYVAAGVAAGVIIAGAIVLAPETGGASLVALAAV